MRSSRFPGRDRHNILLVDDEALFLSSLQEGLARSFPTVQFHGAEDGEAAMAVLDRYPIDLVITDLKMPRLDGFGLLACMSSRHPGVPALVMTAYGTDTTEHRAVAAGAIECIDKPIDLNMLVGKIEAILDPETRGMLRGVSLPAFLQLLGMERLTGVVTVTGPTGMTRLYLKDGQLIHADSNGASGLDVALRTVALARVEIELRQQNHHAPRTIALSLTELLLESARLHDESTGENLDMNLDDAFTETHEGESPATTIGRVVADVPGLAQNVAPNVRRTLEEAMRIDGALGVALVDSESGTTLDSLGNIGDLDVAVLATGNSEVVRAKLRTIASLDLKDTLEDILITLRDQYHVIRTFAKRPSIFVYIALDRRHANLGMARHLLSEIERRLTL